MATESVTKAVEFNHAPAFPCGLFQVNAGIDAFHAAGTASILLKHVKDRLVDAVNGQALSDDDAYILALLTDMARATYTACGVEA